jgi:hypothetical protein
MFKKVVLFAAALTLALGCNKSDEEAPDITPENRIIEFKGKPDAQYVGTWKLKNADIRYKLEADGKYRYFGTVSSPGGVQKIDASGKWAVEGNTFYVTSDKDGQVSDYDFMLEGKVLTLTSKGMRKVKSTYDKE